MTAIEFEAVAYGVTSLVLYTFGHWIGATIALALSFFIAFLRYNKIETPRTVSGR